VRKKRYLTALAALAAAALAAPSIASADAPTYMLDAHDPSPSVAGYAGPAVTDAPLTDGVWYVAEVEGRFSYYSQHMWDDPFGRFDDICGDPFSRPTYYSPDVPRSRQTAAGMDAEFIIARPCGGPEGAKTPQPGRWPNFEINPGDGAGYRHIDTTSGRLAQPSWSGAYDYAFQGHGLKAKFRLRDLVGATGDNFGQLSIYVRPATFNDCEHDLYPAFGFADFASCWNAMMANQGADTYVAESTAVKTSAGAKSKKSGRR